MANEVAHEHLGQRTTASDPVQRVKNGFGRRGDGIVDQTANPALPEIQEERDRTVIRFGKTEIVQTADSIQIQARCRSI